MHRDDVTLIDIVQAARLIIEFSGQLTREQFLEDVKTQSAVLYQLLVIGEAVKRLSPEFRAEHPDIPWRLIAGMRDYLIHTYGIVDWDEVWKTAKEDVPQLLQDIEPLLPE